MTEKDYEYMVAGNYSGAVYTNDRPSCVRSVPSGGELQLEQPSLFDF